MLQDSKCEETCSNGGNNLLNSSIKTKHSSVARSLNFTPLRLSLLQKDILEAANEPLNSVDVLESEEEKEDEIANSQEEDKKGDDLPKGDDNQTNNEVDRIGLNRLLNLNEVLDENDDITILNQNNSSNNAQQKCFDAARIKNILVTTEAIDEKGKKTCKPQREVPSSISENNIVLRTPTQRIEPRIQCSIDMGSLLKTPLNQMRLPKNALSTGKFEAPIRFNGTLSGHFNGEVLKIDNVFESVTKDKRECSAVVRTPGQFPNNRRQVQYVSNGNDNTNKVQEYNLSSNVGLYSFNSIRVKGKSYVVLKELGRGGSSVVYFCFNPITKEERAIKKVFLNRNESSAIEYMNEIKILQKLQKCDRIIKMYDSEVQEHPVDGRILLVVLEKGGADLSKILKKVSGLGKPLANHVIVFYWMEMLFAVKQIHENGIIHSDLKPANFIKAESSLKLIDFGIASCIQGDMTSVIKNVAIGSFEYISPEALLNDNSKNSPQSPNFGKPKFKISFRSDVWSLGCILYQLVYGKTPFQNVGNISAKLAMIMDPNHKIAYPPISHLPDKLLNTIKKCLCYNVKERPSIDELIGDFEE